MKKNNLFSIFFITIGMLALYFQPIYFNYPIYYDSGVFSYVGNIVINNKLPYIDAWDHKGLWIYFYNALGLYLGGGNIRGIYILEYSLVISSILLSIKLIYNNKIQMLPLLGMIGSYAVFFEGGNLPETIFFPWQLAFYAFTFSILRPNHKKTSGELFFLALLASIALFCGLLTRPNNAGGVIVLILFLCLTKDSLFRKILILIIAIFLTILSYYLIKSGIYSEMKNNYLNYNFYYSKMSVVDRLKNAILFTTFLFLSPIGLVLLSKFIRLKYKKITNYQFYEFFKTNKCNIFYIVLLVDLLSQMVSGRIGEGYLHYSIVVIPSMFILSNFILDNRKLIKIPLGQRIVNYFIILSTIFFIVAFNYRAYSNFYYLTDIKNEMILNIKKYTTPDDPIYVSWGDAWIYVASNRYSFTRFFYPIPIMHTDFDGRDRLAVLREEYKHSPPKVLVSWNNELFKEGVSIPFLRNQFSADYVQVENDYFYSIYLRK